MLLGKIIMDLRKVYGGTPVGQASRCDSCVYSRIIRGYAQSEKITLCDRLFAPIRIPFSVMECTDYLGQKASLHRGPGANCLGATKQERREEGGLSRCGHSSRNAR